MKVKEITTGIGYTHNLGNYESIRFEVRLVADVTEQENVEVATASLFAECEKQLYSEYATYMDRIGRGGVQLTSGPGTRKGGVA
jgi:hypothetical protein